jgi:hypothetical protein
MPGETATQFTVTSDIERGVTYQFRLRAENIFGIGEASDVTEIKAAGGPYQILEAPVTAIDSADGSFKITW